MKQDIQVIELIRKERERQETGLELIASENYVSDGVLSAMGSICTNKYAEGYPGKRYYGGCEVVDKIEQLAIDRLKALYDAQWTNVQPHSGAQANMAVILSLLSPGDTFMGLDLSQGGHLTHGSPVNVSGMLFNAVPYGLNPSSGRIDYDKMEETALGAENSMPWEHLDDTIKAVNELRDAGYTIVSVEQTEHSVKLPCFERDKEKKYALIFGNEVNGVQQEVVDCSDFALEIPQFGTKHSLNVSVSIGVVLWQCIK